MKKMFLLVAVLFATTIGLNAQSAKLKGIVQYQYNDHIGYKVDVGAEVYVISKQNAPSSFSISDWNEYEESAIVSIKYWKYINEPADAFTKLDPLCAEQLKQAMACVEDVALVDNSGKYELDLQYGTYYIIAKSKNRNRSFSITESESRILVKEVVINKPTAILSFDFCY